MRERLKRHTLPDQRGSYTAFAALANDALSLLDIQAAEIAVLKAPPAMDDLAERQDARITQLEAALHHVEEAIARESRSAPVLEFVRATIALAGVKEPIPSMIYYNAEHDNFYDQHNMGCGLDFYRKWKPRWREFPTSANEVRQEK